jgi:hypothetical protein
VERASFFKHFTIGFRSDGAVKEVGLPGPSLSGLNRYIGEDLLMDSIKESFSEVGKLFVDLGAEKYLKNNIFMKNFSALVERNFPFPRAMQVAFVASQGATSAIKDHESLAIAHNETYLLLMGNDANVKEVFREFGKEHLLLNRHEIIQTYADFCKAGGVERLSEGLSSEAKDVVFNLGNITVELALKLPRDVRALGGNLFVYYRLYRKMGYFEKFQPASLIDIGNMLSEMRIDQKYDIYIAAIAVKEGYFTFEYREKDPVGIYLTPTLDW